MKLVQLLLCLMCVNSSLQYLPKHVPEQGKFVFSLSSSPDKKSMADYVSKTLYNMSTIAITVNTKSEKCKSKKPVHLRWLIWGTHCKGETGNHTYETFLDNWMRYPGMIADVIQETVFYAKNYEEESLTEPISGGKDISCNEVASLKFVEHWDFASPTKDEKTSTSDKSTDDVESKPSTNDKSDIKPDSPSPQSRRKRDTLDDTKGSNSNEGEKSTKPPTKAPSTTATPSDKDVVAQVPAMGGYTVVLAIETQKDDEPAYFDITVKMKSPVGYLSAHEYPLLTFYMIMCIIYVLYAVSWLVMSACNYHDLLRVQFWIGGVILLGMIEKAVHYSEFLTVNTTGVSSIGTEKFAEVVSAFKRAVARMLVIIVSLGFGIVKPRLGPTLHRVIGIGIVYFVLAVIESMLRIDGYFHPASREAWIVSYIPLAVLDSIICWWVFASLLQTMKTLRLRRNTTKLSLYRHFANTIIFCVIASVIMMLWFIYHRQPCVRDFTNSWLETACWPILFSIILFVIMILWRPNANNQRYAYSPMIDGNDSDLDDMEEPMLGSGATENMKMRGTKKTTYIKSDVEKTEDDLKWIEENIPQTVADAALPALMDSDEEVMTTKYEMSKME